MLSLETINSMIDKKEDELAMADSNNFEELVKIEAQLEVLHTMAQLAWEVEAEDGELEEFKTWLDEQVDYAYEDTITMADLA